MTDIAFIGFGEAARAIAQGWGLAKCAGVTAYDVKLDGSAAEEISRACHESGVACADGRENALAQARHVFCLVTADQAATAARQSAKYLRPGAVWFDGNSCAPDSKRQSAKIVTEAGATYVDLAIMAPIYPRLHKTPLLVAGPETVLSFLDDVGMQYRYCGPEIGAASAVKMIRSVMIKGTEALIAECFLAANRANVLDEVLLSLQGSEPRIDWDAKATYDLERMMQHGLRRAAEMREVAMTLDSLGIFNDQSSATVSWQQRIGELGLRDYEGGLKDRLRMIDEALCLSATSDT